MMRTALLLTFALAGYGQITAPQLGLVPDGPTLRPVAGIPASAVVGSPIALTRHLTRAVTASSQPFAVAVDADSGEVLLVTNDAVPLANTAPNPDRIVLSPRGSAVLLWYSAVHQALIISGLPSNPTVLDIDLTFAHTDPLAFALTDDGATLAITLPNIAYAFSRTGTAAYPSANPILALAFAPGSSDLALVSAVDVMLSKAGGTSAPISFSSPLKPNAAALDARRLTIADASGAIVTLDLASTSLSTRDCQCAPLGLFQLSRSSYRLTALDAGSFKLFDADQNAVLFAPLALTPTPTSGGIQ